MKYELEYANSFKKDLKTCKKEGTIWLYYKR